MSAPAEIGRPLRWAAAERLRIGRGRVVDVLPFLIPLSLCGPMLWYQQSFAVDWGNHLYLVATMEHSLRTLHHPSYFLHTGETGLYYPIFAFYGGPLYSITGLLAIVLGSPVRAYVVSWALGFAMTYGGMYWLARETRLRGLLAHAPAITTVTGAYYLTNVYARSAWTEFEATSAIPLMVAGIVALLHARRPTVLAILGTYVGAIVFSGSHNITLLWGTIILAVVTLAAAIACGPTLIRARIRRIGLTTLVLALGLGTNLWYLLPDLVYSKQTTIGKISAFQYFMFDRVGIIFAPWHRAASPLAATLFVQVPVYVLAWTIGLLAIGLVRGIGAGRMRLFTALLVATTVGVFVLAIFDSLWRYLPHTLELIQFPYRLESYLLLLIAGLSLIAVHVAVRLPRRRVAFATLALALVCQIGLAEHQAWTAKHEYPGSTFTKSLGTGHVPPTWYGFVDYRVQHGPSVLPTAPAPLPAELVRDDRLSVPIPDPPGLYETNVAFSPFVRASGAAKAAGWSPNNVLMVVNRTGHEPKGALLTVQPAYPLAEKIGTAVSILSVIVLVVVCVLVARRRSPGRSLPA